MDKSNEVNVLAPMEAPSTPTPEKEKKKKQMLPEVLGIDISAARVAFQLRKSLSTNGYSCLLETEAEDDKEPEPKAENKQNNTSPSEVGVRGVPSDSSHKSIRISSKAPVALAAIID